MYQTTGNSNESTPVIAAEQSTLESNDPSEPGSMQAGGQIGYLDFEIEIREGKRHQYPIAVLNSPGGETSSIMSWPYTHASLEEQLSHIDDVLLRASSRRRRRLDSSEKTIQEFGTKLFDALIADEVRSLYDVSREKAFQQGYGLRIKLRISEPKLATLPWEYMYDRRHDQYIGLSNRTPIVRYLESQLPPRPLIAAKPLRILGLAASPKDASPINSSKEKKRVETALKDLIDQGLVELKWIEGSSWRDLQRELLQGPWHIFHFIGHGFFDADHDEGYVVLTDEDGNSDCLSATSFAQMLTDHRALRLVLLNACDGAKASVRDTLSSSASILVKQGIPAVLAMQNEISNSAAVECARSFYQSIAYGHPVDAAAADARKGIALEDRNSPEWGVPVLYMRSPDGRLLQTLRDAKGDAKRDAKVVHHNQNNHNLDQFSDTAQQRSNPQPVRTDELVDTKINEPSGAPTVVNAEESAPSGRRGILAKHSNNTSSVCGSSDQHPTRLGEAGQAGHLAKLSPKVIFQLRLALAVVMGLGASTLVKWLFASWVMISTPISWASMGLVNSIAMRSSLSSYGKRIAGIPLLWAGVWSLAYAQQWVSHQWFGQPEGMLQRGESINWMVNRWGLRTTPIFLNLYNVLGMAIAFVSQTFSHQYVTWLLTANKWLRVRLPSLLAIAGAWFVLPQLAPEFIRISSSAWLVQSVGATGEFHHTMGWASHWAGGIVIAQFGMSLYWMMAGQFTPLFLALGTIVWSLLIGVGTAGIGAIVGTPSVLSGTHYSLIAGLLTLPLLTWVWHFEKKSLYQQFRSGVQRDAHGALRLLEQRGQLTKADIGDQLRGAVLDGINLAGYSFHGVDLSEASLIDANLSGAQLQNCDLRNANLTGSFLVDANLSEANMSGATIVEAHTLNLNVCNALYDSHTIWPDDFDYRKSGAIGPSAILKEKNLKHMDLSGMDLIGVNFMGANLDYANLSGADLTKANFRGANLSGVDLTEIQYKNASFREATYNDETRWPQGFKPEKRGAILVADQEEVSPMSS